MIKMLSIKKMKEFARWLKHNPQASYEDKKWKYEKLANEDSKPHLIHEVSIAGDRESFTKQLIDYAAQF